jgi:hypothetical protein
MVSSGSSDCRFHGVEILELILRIHGVSMKDERNIDMGQNQMVREV